MAKVYLVEEHYDNGEAYEDNVYSISVVAVAATEEKAKAWIASQEIDGDWTEGNPYKDKEDEACIWKDVVRSFYVAPRYKGDEYAMLFYRIREMEVTE